VAYFKIERSDSRCLLLGVGLACFVALLHVTTLASVAVGLKPGWPAALVAVLLLFVLTMLLHDDFATAVVWGVVGPITFVIATAFLSSQVMDASYDGLMYHQTGVLRLLSGWNSFRDGSSGSIWVDAYPKASWLVGASLASLMGTVEAMKAQNFALLAASGCLVFGALRFGIPALSRSYCVLLASLAAMNPVALSQLLTGYNDGLLGSGLTCLVALAAIAIFRAQERRWLIHAILLLPFVVNLKFTAIPYTVVLLLAGLASLAFVAERLPAVRLGISLSAALMLAVFFLGFDPYVKNTLQHGHPFYPVFGEGKINVMEANLPDALQHAGYLTKLAAGIFASPMAGQHGEIAFSWLPRWRQIEQYSVPDVRLAGFGPLFAMTLMLSVAILAAVRKMQLRQRWLLGCALVLALSGLINPEAWWARYVPQLWLALTCTVACLATDSRLLTRRLAASVAAVMLLNAASVAAASAAAAVWKSRYWATSLTALRDESRSGPPLRIQVGNHLATPARLDRWGVRYSVVSDSAPCLNPRPLLPPPRAHLSDARICQQIVGPGT
jgi:hypothetical protein